jgi:hypothetical protein
MALKLHPIIVLAIISLAFSFSTYAQTPIWQGSLDNNEPIKLSVRSKLGTEAYDATFIVKQKDSDKSYSKQIQVRADEWGTVRFPLDYVGVPNEIWDTGGQRQLYEWECRVKGEGILNGSFYYPNYQLEIDKSDE